MAEHGEVIDLADADLRAHAADERIIERGLDTFLDVGAALVRIRDRRSYLLAHHTFADYLTDRWQLEQRYAYSLMESATCAAIVTAAGLPAPANPRVALALAPLRSTPDHLVEVWRALVTAHGKPVTRDVQTAVARIRTARTEPEPDGSRTDTLAARHFTAALENAAHALEAAEGVRVDAARDASRTQLHEWREQLETLKRQISSVRAPLARRLKSVPRK